MQETTNLHLKLPESTDFYNVEDQNANMRILDAEIVARANNIAYDPATGTLSLKSGDTALATAKLDIHFTNIIIRTLTPGFVGQTITITKDDEPVGSVKFIEVVGTEGIKGIASFRATEIGTYTFTCGGKSKSITITELDTVAEVSLNQFTIYGFHISGSEGQPSAKVTYPSGVDNADYTPAHMDFETDTFHYGSWSASDFFMPKPCMLTSAGAVAYYLKTDDFTKKADGTASDVANTSYAGNAMMEWGRDGKRIWYKVVADEGDTSSATVYIADGQVDDDFVAWSFYDCNGALKEHFYTPIYNGSRINSVCRSLSGQTCMNSQTGANEITYAKANNTGSEEHWNTEVLADAILINFLLILIGKSTNTQAVFGNGHYTGGTGAASLLQTGTMNTKGLFWGTNGTGAGVKVFGMENWYGNIWRRYAGHINDKGKQKIKLTWGTQDGSRTDGYNTDGTGYIEIADAVPSGTSGGYLSKMKFDKYGMHPSVASGSDTTHYCDGMWFNNGQVDYAFRGGACSDGFPVGALYVALDNVVTVANWYIGAAPSYK